MCPITELRILNQAHPVAPGQSGPVWLGYGFRPFFLGACLIAPALVMAWLCEWLLGEPAPHALPGLLWHAHEMVFGFSAAVVAGFLLTAVPNWTGVPTPRGYRLGLLFGLWLAARLMLLSPWLTPGAGLDLLFYPCLALALAGPLVNAKRGNLMFLPIVAALGGADALFWGGVLSGSAGLTLLGRDLGIGLTLLLVSIIGGRVIPFFAASAIRGMGDGCLIEWEARRWPWVETVCPPLVLLAALPLPVPVVVGVDLAAGIVHGIRLYGWYDRRIWKAPLLWILYVVSFLSLGFLLRGGAGLGWWPASPALHAHTVGCIAVMILGMMARVALGHSGRELRPAPTTVAVFGLVIAAAVARTLLPLLGLPYRLCLVLSGSLWAAAFLGFAWVYVPILLSPRADGKPG